MGESKTGGKGFSQGEVSFTHGPGLGLREKKERVLREKIGSETRSPG